MNADRGTGSLLGLAVADALGAPLEFSSPAVAASAAARGLEMTGGGVWEPGEWTDDTAMALALAESIIARGLLDLDDLAGRYAAWAASGPKDIGITISGALRGVRSAADALSNAEGLHRASGRTAGNGTVMRAAPIALAAQSRQEASEAARADARLTHWDPMAGAASAALCAALLALASGEDPFERALEEAEPHPLLTDAVRSASENDRANVSALVGGPAFGTCWAALAVGLTSLHDAGYEEGVTWAISLGRDTDTNAAVAGALLGCRSGGEDIPARWLRPLRERERIEELAASLSAG